jgi:D-alanyl-D-alanine carboxypeptidase
MTAVVVLETYKLDDVVTISATAANQIGATANFRVGEKLTVRSLLKAMLIKSANGAAYALAEHMNDKNDSGDDPEVFSSNSTLDFENEEQENASLANQDEEGVTASKGVINQSEKTDIAKFITAMNNKAMELGMENTEYRDPAGLDTTGYSSAYDLYLITKYALKKDLFAEIVKTDHDVVKDTSGTIWHDLKNSNRLVGEYKYQGAIGVKTGYMPDAGHILVSAAKRDGHTLVGVIINTFADTPSASADESRKMLDWGFENTIWQ